MWTWSLDWGEVGPTLLVGSCPMRPTDLGRIRHQTGATAILSLQHDDCLAYWGIDYAKMQAAGVRNGLQMERCPMRDFNIEDQQRRLPAAVARLTRLQRQGHRTYVHCTAGLGRSPLTLWAYLVMVEGWEPSRAIEAIRRVRPAVVPSWEALQGCREDLLAKREAQVAERAYALYRQGMPGDAQQHWFLAQRQVLRECFLGAVDERL
jgi:hypothetical protein